MATTEYLYCDPALKITNFRYTDWLRLGRSNKTLKNKRAREASYVVMRDYSVTMQIDGMLHVITVPKGMTTDLASVPKAFRNLIGRVGPHLEACIVHDWLYVAWQLQDREPTKADWKFANRVLYAGLKAAKCSWFTRTGMRLAMEAPYFSWSVFRGRDENTMVKVPR
jgi:hypothetical protein